MTTIENEDKKAEAIQKIASLKQPEPGSEAEEELMQTVSAVAGFVTQRDKAEVDLAYGSNPGTCRNALTTIHAPRTNSSSPANTQTMATALVPSKNHTPQRSHSQGEAVSIGARYNSHPARDIQDIPCKLSQRPQSSPNRRNRRPEPASL